MGGRPSSIWPSGVEDAAGKTTATRPRNTRVGPQQQRQSRGERSSGGPAGSTTILPFHPPAPSLLLSRMFAVDVDFWASQRFYFSALLLLHPSFSPLVYYFRNREYYVEVIQREIQEGSVQDWHWCCSLIFKMCFRKVHHCLLLFTVSFEITFI